MAAYTSKATGNWDASGQTTWNEVGVPGNGDTVTIAINHTITIPDGVNVIIGTSGPTGTEAVRLTGTSGGQGKLIVGQTTGATLTLRGDLILADAHVTRVLGRTNLTINAGSTVTFDSSQATTPLSQIYVIGPSAGTSPNNNVLINGTQARPVTITSNASGGNGRFSGRGFGTRVGRMTATWCNFSRLGDASNAWVETSFRTQSTLVDADTFSLTDCTLDTCGHENQTVSLNNGTVYQMTRVKRTNSLSTSCLRVPADEVSTVAANRALTDCYFDVTVGNGSATFAGYTFTRCVLYGSWRLAAHASIKWSFVDCLIRKSLDGTATGGQVAVTSTAGGDMTRCYYLIDNTTQGNAKWFNNPTGYDVTLDGGHLEGMHLTDNTGDYMSVVNAPGSLRNITIKRHTISFNPDGNLNERSETLWSVASSTANVALYSEHNTWIASTEAHLSIGETASSPAGVIKSFKSNITYGTRSPVGNAQWHIHDRDANSTNAQLAASAGDINYNCGFGLKAASDGVGYQLNCAGTPGANDINVDPQFVDVTRNLAKWNQSRGGTATLAAALATLQSDPSLVPAAYSWVQGGWAPQNVLLRNAGHDGLTIGAVEYSPPSTSDGMFLASGLAITSGDIFLA